MRSERGAAPAIEAAIILPGLALLVGLIVALARIVTAQHDVSAITGNAARAASLERLPDKAQSAARSTVDAELGEHGLVCSEHQVNIDTSEFGKPPGTSAHLTVEFRCVLGLEDITFPGFPGHITVDAVVVSPLDRYRGR